MSAKRNALRIIIQLIVYASHKKTIIIESVDSINRDERGLPLTQYITNWGISRAR